MNLDDTAGLVAADPGGMRLQVADLTRQVAQADTRRSQVHAAVGALGERARRATELVVCGMGGSAIGADYAAVWAAPLGARVHVHRGYGVPPWCGASTLFVFSSYSGDTEETLDAFAAAPAASARLVLTTGGALARAAQAQDVPVLALPAGLQPRAALGHSLLALVWLLHETGLVRVSPAAAIAAAARHLEMLAPTLAPEAPRQHNRAKQLAAASAGQLLWIVSGNGYLEPVGRRWKAQINENAKSLALCSVVPEMNHNEIMAPPLPLPVCQHLRMLCLADAADPPPVARRLALTAELLAAHVAGTEVLTETAAEPLARLLGATLLADYTSIYLAFLQRVDPLPVARIQDFKARLRAAG